MTLPTSRSGNFVWRQISLLGRMPLGQKSRQRHHKFIILSYSKAKLAKRKFSSSEILFLNFEAPKKFFDMKEKNYNSNLFPLLAGFSKILELSLTRENWPSSIFCLWSPMCTKAIFVELACCLPVLDGFDWHYRASLPCDSSRIRWFINCVT